MARQRRKAEDDEVELKEEDVVEEPEDGDEEVEEIEEDFDEENPDGEDIDEPEVEGEDEDDVPSQKEVEKYVIDHPKESAIAFVKALEHVEELERWFNEKTQGKGSLDNPEAIKHFLKAGEKFVKPFIEYMKNALHEVHGENGVDPDELLEAHRKAISREDGDVEKGMTSDGETGMDEQGERGMANRGNVPESKEEMEDEGMIPEADVPTRAHPGVGRRVGPTRGSSTTMHKGGRPGQARPFAKAAPKKPQGPTWKVTFESGHEYDIKASTAEEAREEAEKKNEDGEMGSIASIKRVIKKLGQRRKFRNPGGPRMDRLAREGNRCRYCQGTRRGPSGEACVYCNGTGEDTPLESIGEDYNPTGSDEAWTEHEERLNRRERKSEIYSPEWEVEEGQEAAHRGPSQPLMSRLRQTRPLDEGRYDEEWGTESDPHSERPGASAGADREIQERYMRDQDEKFVRAAHRPPGFPTQGAKSYRPEEVLERSYDPRTKSWITRQVGVVRRTKNGKSYLVRTKDRGMRESPYARGGDYTRDQILQRGSPREIGGYPSHHLTEGVEDVTPVEYQPGHMQGRGRSSRGPAVHAIPGRGKKPIMRKDDTPGLDQPRPRPDLQPTQAPNRVNNMSMDNNCKGIAGVVKDAGRLMQVMSQDTQVPRKYKKSLTYHSKSLHTVSKALTNMGKVQRTGGKGSPLTAQGSEGWKKPLTDEGQVQAKPRGNSIRTSDSVAERGGHSIREPRKKVAKEASPELVAQFNRLMNKVGQVTGINVNGVH